MIPAADVLDVSIVTPEQVLFSGKAQSVVLPGEMGFFEVQVNHKPLFSLLMPGRIVVDHRSIPIWRGIVRVALNRIAAIVETAPHD
jgi:F-type H+-transporting ATPase subunit epsilon